MYHKWKSCDVWFLRYGAQQTFFFSFWTIFCPFTPLTTRKKNLKKKKENAWKYHHYTQVCHKWHTWCMVPEIWSVTQFFVILGHFLPFYNTNNPETQIFEKMKKKKTPEEIIILHVFQKLWSDDVRFLGYGAQRRDGRTDGKSNI